MQFRAQGSDGTSAACEHLPVVECHLHECAKPVGRGIHCVELLLKQFYLREMRCNNRRPNLFLGLEVIIDIAERHLGLLGDIRKTRLPESVLVAEVHGRLNESAALVRVLLRCHSISESTNSYCAKRGPASRRTCSLAKHDKDPAPRRVPRGSTGRAAGGLERPVRDLGCYLGGVGLEDVSDIMRRCIPCLAPIIPPPMPIIVVQS